MTRHGWLVKIACRYLLRDYPVVIAEMAAGREQPDAIGFDHGGRSMVIECKASRRDFLADRKKSFRRGPYGMGQRRAYLAPKGLIKSGEVPAGWTLLEVDDKGFIRGTSAVALLPDVEADARGEIGFLVSLMRRLPFEKRPGVSIRAYRYETANRAVALLPKDTEP